MTTRRPGRGQRGFTLIEVLIALAILFGGLVMMLSRVTADVQATNQAKLMTAATGLARAKMLDIEEELLQKGFQETAETMEGDFADEGFPRYTWKATVEKIELPPLAQMQAAQGAEGQGAGTTPGASGTPAVPSGPASQAGGASMLSGSFDMVTQILEGAVRKVTLTVEWQAGRRKESMTVVCYFTDPKAVDSGLGGLLGGAAPKDGTTPPGTNPPPGGGRK
jgi:general secretion pathway protein I